MFSGESKENIGKKRVSNTMRIWWQNGRATFMIILNNFLLIGESPYGSLKNDLITSRKSQSFAGKSRKIVLWNFKSNENEREWNEIESNKHNETFTSGRNVKLLR